MKTKLCSNQPQWSSLSVESSLPAGLEKMQEIAYNYWWSWNSEFGYLMREIDEKLWFACGANPVLFIERLSLAQLEELSANRKYMDRLNEIYARFRAYMAEPHRTDRPSVAYFCMEYGISEVLKIYSGGLGILAGDYIKEASDCNVDLTAVGFLYRQGYFTQGLSMDGQQIAIYDNQNFNKLPLRQLKNADGTPFDFEVEFPGYTVHCNVWLAQVGRTELYLMDTDHPLNSEYDRQITYQLYGGDWENRMKQEYLLGIGGVQLLNKLGIKKDVYHANEGHAALMTIQRMVDLVQEHHLTFNQALEVVRSSSLYTCHTPVPAGHDKFDEGLFNKYMNAFPGKLGISWAELMDLGRETPGDYNEKFSMSVVACNCCQEVNGVSWLHGEVSKKMFAPIWKGYFPNENHVSYVTNGVHMPTWAAAEWRDLYDRTFGQGWMSDQSNEKIWEKIYQVNDEEIWKTRQARKEKLIDYIKQQYRTSWLKNQNAPQRTLTMLESINANALMIGFGRRFATYKRAHLLFTDLERLDRIVNNPKYPVQFVFTGKAHPADGGGQGLIRRIVEISRMPQFQGKVIFLENYDISLAKRLISGVDIWLNTPTRPLEASGTSGQKAEMNGVLNFSVLDGWWLEGYKKGAGWALTEKRTYQNQEYQDQLDAATIYYMLENEIVPLYYSKNDKGYSPEWVKYIKNSIAHIAPHFTTKRMLDDYMDRFYTKLASRSAYLCADDYARTRELVAWKEKIASVWDKITVDHVDYPHFVSGARVGEECPVAVTLDVSAAGISSGLGVELVITEIDIEGVEQHYSMELNQVACEEGKMRFELQYSLKRAGTFNYAFRMFPKHADMPHRMDFCYVRWF